MDFLREVRRNRSLSNTNAAKAVHRNEVIAEASKSLFDTVIAITIPLLLVTGYIALITYLSSPTNTYIAIAGPLVYIGPSLILVSSFVLSTRLTRVTRYEFILTVCSLLVCPIWIPFAFLIGFCFAFPLPAGLFWGTFVGVAFGTRRSIDVGLIVGLCSLLLGTISALIFAGFGNAMSALAVMALAMGVLIPVATTYLALAHRVAIRPHDVCWACHYTLTGLTTDRCPECGTPVTRPSMP